MTEHIEVQHVPGQQRFEVTVDDTLAGVAAYIDGDDGVRSFTSTHVDDRHKGRGIGSTLIEHALQATVDEGLKIQPICSFVVKKAAEERWRDHVVSV